jgi:hypothetical protein
MATKTPRLLFVIVILVGFSSFLSAQSANYYSVIEGGQTRFFQRLAWSGGEYALRYEVVIERSVEGRYIAHLRDFTTSLFIIVSLPPGEYRFRVIPYDILDRPGEGSRWVNLDVRHAVRPELMGMSSGFYSSGIDDQPSGYVLKIEGNDIVPGAEVFIRRPGGTLIPSDVLSFGEGSEILIFVDDNKADPGEYELVVKNPGGLESSIGGIVLQKPDSFSYPESEPAVVLEPETEDDSAVEPEPENEKFTPLGPALVNFGAAWTPLAHIHGESFSDGFYPVSFGFHTDTVAFIPIGIYIGPELTMFLHSNGEDEGFVTVGINLLSMRWLSGQRTALSFRFGVSYIIIPDPEDRLMLNIGLSLVFRVTNKFLFETGIDYVNQLREVNSNGFFRPWIGIGRML